MKNNKKQCNKQRYKDLQGSPNISYFLGGGQLACIMKVINEVLKKSYNGEITLKRKREERRVCVWLRVRVRIIFVSELHTLHSLFIQGVIWECMGKSPALKNNPQQLIAKSNRSWLQLARLGQVDQVRVEQATHWSNGCHRELLISANQRH